MKNKTTGEVHRGKLLGTDDGGKTYTYDTANGGTWTAYTHNGGRGAVNSFNKDFGSREPKNSDLHDNINKRSSNTNKK